MCGIAGIISKERFDCHQIEGMLEKIKHRGPNFRNYIQLFDDKVWIGHARLSIIDLSADANQPMFDEQGQLCLSFNGEIYNYLELRQELIKKGFIFRTLSDTEVILAAYREWGIKCLDRFNGMFAFIIIDKERRTFFAARDRYGVKPLYYWKNSSSELLYFASEIKAFTGLPGWRPKVNGQRVYDYLNFGLTDHTRETMVKDIFQIRGGEYCTGTLDSPITSFSLSQWYTPTINSLHISEEEAAEQFKTLFFDSLKLRLRSDVKIGSCLSGGLDSSSIVCAVNDLLKETGCADAQKTVSALATGTQYDKSKYINIVLSERKIDGYCVEPSPEELWEIQNKLIWHQDEPFGSTSIYAQWCVFAKAKEKNLTVMLDGQGADELLAGYQRFFLPFYSQLFKRFHWTKLAEELQYTKQYYGHSWKTVAKGVIKTTFPATILNGLSNLRNNNGVMDWYSIDKLGAKKNLPLFYGSERAQSLGELSKHLFFYNNMPMLLRYEDRNSMAHSIESRLPFLDYRLVEFAQSLPDYCKINQGKTKAVLRNAMKSVLPKQIQNRMDKIGFETAEEKWERENLLGVRNMIERSIEKTNGIINKNALKYFDNIISKGKRDFTIWRMINFGIWYDLFINNNYKQL